MIKRKYITVLGLTNLYNFNSNNDITPWKEYQFQKLYRKIFPIKFEDSLSFVQYYLGEFNYNIYKKEISPITQVIEYTPNGNIREVKRINHSYYPDWEWKEVHGKHWAKLVKGHEEAGTLLQFGEHNIDKIKELCFNNKGIK